MSGANRRLAHQESSMDIAARKNEIADATLSMEFYALFVDQLEKIKTNIQAEISKLASHTPASWGRLFGSKSVHKPTETFARELEKTILHTQQMYNTESFSHTIKESYSRDVESYLKKQKKELWYYPHHQAVINNLLMRLDEIREQHRHMNFRLNQISIARMEMSDSVTSYRDCDIYIDDIQAKIKKIKCNEPWSFFSSKQKLSDIHRSKLECLENEFKLMKDALISENLTNPEKTRLFNKVLEHLKEQKKTPWYQHRDKELEKIIDRYIEELNGIRRNGNRVLVEKNLQNQIIIRR